ncbi:N-acetylneuraminate synthase [Bizionia argentinensis JUB59]|uniref:N-acetylneuraminate synthase n=1 Tax=Bizionia argentinensis JUB59 TaxID=1046627 RepID=G2EAT1_9FLAO|nr:N-acetylneuraminate synthase family protein [Bizionia argentinensis]EGV44412.1 N-acetylneuraminate synthase [Bizionia argentinensis JUB59]
MNALFLIAEIAQAHGGCLQKAHDYIDAVATTGVDAIKFQTHIADAESSIHEPFRVKFSDAYATRFDYWRAMEFTLDEWKALKQHCEAVGLEFMSSPFSNAAVDLLEIVGVNRYKVGSGEVSNFLLLERISQTKKPVILSSGMSSYDELDAAVSFLKKRNVDYSIMQCTTAYPTNAEQLGLNVIQELKDRYQVLVGFSDHSALISTGVAAVSLGAELLEFHVILDSNESGPDALASLTIEQATQLNQDVRYIYKALQHPINKIDSNQFSDLKQIFEKSLAVNKTLPKGHVLTFADLEAKKPKGYGIHAFEFENVIGKQLNTPLKKWDFLNHKDIDNE